MAEVPRGVESAKVDFLVDEKGSRIELPQENEGIRGARDRDPTVGGTGPTNWWRLGLVVIAAIALVLLVMQMMSGGARTDVVPGTPTTPGPEAPAPQQ